MHHRLAIALTAAREAATIIQRYVAGEAFDVRLKDDLSPVTAADVEVEEKIKEILSTEFPDDGFYGEETGKHGDREAFWLVDPIDGTKSFVRKTPFLSTQIAFMNAGRLELGVSNAPLYGELAYAVRGEGAFLNDVKVAVSDIDTLTKAHLSFGNLKTLARSPRFAGVAELITRVDRTRGYGDFAHYHLLARGALDIVVESDVNILDVAALTVLIEEAGGRVTDLFGQPLGLDSTTIVATNGRLHEEVLSLVHL